MRERSALIAPVFQSRFSHHLEAFLAGKRAAGYKYNQSLRTLQYLDRFFSQEAVTSRKLPKEVVDRWSVRRPHEHPTTHAIRVGSIRQFAEYLMRQGIPAYAPHPGYAAGKPSSFVPRILSITEVRNFLSAIDQMKPSPWSPLRHLIMPELFRLLYGCGLRLSEALRLRVRDVDLEEGILSICGTKFGKDRLVPVHPSLLKRLRHYAGILGIRDSAAHFFPARDGGAYSKRTIYNFFREILPKIRITHGGRGFGPRVHDLRHTYAAHRLIQWYREEADLHAKIPILATYLGHQDITCTQKYLHLVPELFPEVTKSVERTVGYVIPRRRFYETH